MRESIASSTFIFIMSRASVFKIALSIGLAVTNASAANIQVQVGKGALKFDPENVPAQVGDTVTYNFFPKVCEYILGMLGMPH